MGAPVSKIEAAEEKTAEILLSVFKHLEAGERRKHATMYNYWLSIRRSGEPPPIRDLDPLEISDAAPSGLLLELTEGGENADILHVGENLRSVVQVKKLNEASDPSLLTCIAGKLGIVTISRDALAFEDHFLGTYGTTRCSVTLLPFSMGGETVDFVYALASIEIGVTFNEEDAQSGPEAIEAVADSAADEVVAEGEQVAEEAEPVPDVAPAEEAIVEDSEPVAESDPEPVVDETLPEPTSGLESGPDEIEIPQFLTEPQPAPEAEAKPGFSKIFDALAGAKGFFGTVAPSEPEQRPASEPEEVEPVAEEPSPAFEEIEAVAADSAPVVEEPEPVAEEPAPIVEEIQEPEPAVEEPAPVAEDTEEPVALAEEPAQIEPEHVEAPRSMEGTLQSKLTEVRSKADEAKAARLRSEALLVEGLSAAYDFALDAEEAPEEYLKLVEAQGLKIQLRSPMKPVVRLAFDGYCDESTIKDFEAVLAWALKADLPKGSLAERIEAEGGIAEVLSGAKRRAGDAN